MSIGMIGAFVLVGFLSFLFGLFYAAMIEARDQRWMAKHLRTRATDEQEAVGASAGLRR